MITLMAAVLALLSASGQVKCIGGAYPTIEVTPDNTTGLKKIFVVYDTHEIEMTYTSSTGSKVTWKRFDWQGGNYHEEVVSGTRWDGFTSTLSQVEGNTGYFIEEDGIIVYYCWVVNYADYYLELNDMFVNNSSPCSLVTFNVDGQGARIPYYSVNGHYKVLDREIKLSYNTLVWSEEKEDWDDAPVVETFESLEDGITIDPPLCDTDFKLSGDRFLEEWGLYQTLDGPHFTTKAVSCGSKAVLPEVLDENGNPTKVEEGVSEGSAPVRIVFTGYPTDAAVFRQWQMATDNEFEDIVQQFNQEEVDYTFMDSGTYYLRFMVANAEGSCEYYGSTYTINISESQLGGSDGRLPNAFSPVNGGKWKVSYKSLVDFHCWIYNRWGVLVHEFTNPDEGWDGKYNGRSVDTGVYFYVITATGSDGVKYNKRGDITILLYKGTSASGEVDNGGY